MSISIGPKKAKAKKSSKKSLIDVELVGVPYKVRKVKPAVGVAVTRAMGSNNEIKMAQAMDAVIVGMFGKETGEQIFDRLMDPDDALEYEHIGELFYAVASYNTSGEDGDANPTG